MPAKGANLALLASPEYFESLARYVPAPEYLAVVRGILPGDWRVVRSETWFSCLPRDERVPAQGWKIHVSAAIAEATEILRKTVAVLVQHGVSFKFALDPTLLRQLNGKNWSRSGSGKFVTVYPHDDEQFKLLLEELRIALDGHAGPYILSDRRYADSKVVHYRYGGLRSITTLTPTGEQRLTLTTPDGTTVDDEGRAPVFSLPAWVTDPFPPAEEEPRDLTLRDGRYAVERVLHFSNTGGVYVALDATTGERVVVKEARPHSGGDNVDADSFALLTKEFAILTALAPAGIAPRPIELFGEWEHLFLVMELLGGVSLWSHTARNEGLLVPRLDAAGARDFLAARRVLWLNLAEAVGAAHDHGVLLGDLNSRNVLVDPDTLAVRLIDFEASIRVGADSRTRLATPGYASPRHFAEGLTGPEDDYYGLGALMLASLLPVNALALVDVGAGRRVLADIAAELGLPASWTATIDALLADDPAARPAPADVVAVLRAEETPLAAVPVRVAPQAEQPWLAGTVAGIVRHVTAAADFGRTDRLYPSDAALFATNPLNVSTGAAGVAYALHRMTGEVPSRALAWILTRDVTPETYPTGLYTGTSGVAWALAELGAVDAATRLMDAAEANPARFATANVQAGAAGYGLACLRLWTLTGDERHLANAVAAGDHLLRIRQVDDQGRGRWPDATGTTWLGYQWGASGIALFLLYLHLATGSADYLDAGSSGLAHDLGHGHVAGDLMSFPQRADRPATVFPYWQNGSAGVGTALVRYYAVTGDETYRKALDPIALDCSRRYALMPSLFRGLAGLGDFLLDCHDLLGEPHFLAEARRVAEGVRLFALDRKEGIAFPGEGLIRLSTDLATGSAGVGLFLHRLATGAGSFNFTLDSLLPARERRAAM